MTPFAQATPSQIAAHQAHQARLGRIWKPQARPVAPRRVVAPVPEPEPPKPEQWPPYAEPVPYDCYVPPAAPSPAAQGYISGKHIIHQVAHKHGLTEAEIRSARRWKPLVAARQECCYRMAMETRLSLTQIGRALGGKDHTSVLYSIRKFARENNLPSTYLRGENRVFGDEFVHT